MWTLYKLVFAAKSLHISKCYKLVQKLETQIEIFPLAVRRCPAVRRSRDRSRDRARGGGGGRSTCEGSRARVTWAAGGTRSRLCGCGSLAMEVDVEMHGAPPRAPWRGTSSLATTHAMERVAEAELLALTRLPPAFYRRSPRLRRCGRRRPHQPRVPSR
jgi:hypothetical protein